MRAGNGDGPKTVSGEDAKPAWIDPDDAPEWTDEMFDRAEIRIGDKIIRRGRPPAPPNAKSPSASTKR
jgi:hypothetical protein